MSNLINKLKELSKADTEEAYSTQKGLNMQTKEGQIIVLTNYVIENGIVSRIN